MADLERRGRCGAPDLSLGVRRAAFFRGIRWPEKEPKNRPSLTWTAAAPPAAGQDTIQSATWTQISPPDAALTITGQSNTSLVASALIGGGTVGNVYTIQIDVTMKSGVILPYQIILTIL